MEFFPIEQILQRYQLRADYTKLYPGDETHAIPVSKEFVNTLLGIFEDEQTFSANAFDRFSLNTMLDYLHRTHQFYLSKKLCEIDQSISILLQNYSHRHPLLLILRDFFTEYKASLTAHIMAEEKHLLPYIKSLMFAEADQAGLSQYLLAQKSYSIQQFINSHHDTEEDLSNIRATILSYEPPPTNQTPYRILLLQLEAFEKDLSVHALIEDEVLIPRALVLEKVIKDFIKKTAPLN